MYHSMKFDPQIYYQTLLCNKESVTQCTLKAELFLK